uniref:Uncharacterized protein n=1 Tax=Vitis vinifera TaxID=29760 RepID=F6HK30_VITVI
MTTKLILCIELFKLDVYQSFLLGVCFFKWFID